MSNKQLWTVIAGLILLNIMSILFFTVKPLKTIQASNTEKGEAVASVGEMKIGRKEWVNELENRYGKEVLQEMVDQEVVAQAAKKYHISVSDKDLNRELMLMKTMYGSYDQQNKLNEKKWTQQVKTNMLLEELLTKDVAVSKEQMEKYYQENKSVYEIPTTYHLSHIVLKTKKDAEQVMKELKDGSKFSTLAIEKSMDEFTANQGGDLGFISEENDKIPSEYLKVAHYLKKSHWSGPIKVDDGYAVIFLHEKIKGKRFLFSDVRNQIRRQIALEQMDNTVSAKMFWDEFKVKWLYENKK